jgi:hypothetical protein
MKFSALKKYIAKLPSYTLDPDVNTDYRPFTIATLVQNGGTASYEELQNMKAESDSTLNQNYRLADFIVRKDGVTVVDKETGNIRMLDFDSYTNAQKAWIVVECALKNKDKKELLDQSVKKKKEELADPESELTKDKKKVLKDYPKTFFTKNITGEKYLEFLNGNNNKHWNNISRPGGNTKKDLPKLQNALKIILDETKPLSERIKKVRDKKSKDWVSNFKYATYTPILLVASNMKHAVINKPVLEAIDMLGFFPLKKFKKLEEWESIPRMQEIVVEVAKRYGFDLWQIDWVWWDLTKNQSNNSQDISPLLIFLREDR